MILDVLFLLDGQICIQKSYIIYGRSDIVPICMSKLGQNFLSAFFLIKLGTVEIYIWIENKNTRTCTKQWFTLMSRDRTRIGLIPAIDFIVTRVLVLCLKFFIFYKVDINTWVLCSYNFLRMIFLLEWVCCALGLRYLI